MPIPQKDVEFTNDEKFYLLLERMDISSGFMNLSQRIAQNNSYVLRLTLDHDELHGIHEESESFPNFFDSSQELKNQKTKKAEYMYIKLKSQAPKETSKRPNSFTMNQSQSQLRKKKTADGPGFVIRNSADVAKRHMSALKKIFEIYCNLGEPENYQWLKHIKF